MPWFRRETAFPGARERRLRLAAAGSLVAVGGFAPIPLGYLLAGPGRGSETVVLAILLGPALLAIAVGLATQAFGFLAIPGDKMVSRATAGAMIGDSLALVVLGFVLLVDRTPCSLGSYCSGQMLGSFGRLAIYLWFPILGIGYLAAGALKLAESAARRNPRFVGGTFLLTVDGLVLLAGLALPLLFPLGWGLGLAVNAVIAAAFLEEAKGSFAGARSS